MFHSIRYKLIAIATLFIVACATTVFMLAIREHEFQYRQLVEKHLAALTDNVADDLLMHLRAPDETMQKAIAGEMSRFNRYDFIMSADVYDDHWMLLHRYMHPTVLEGSRESRIETGIFPQLPVGISVAGRGIIAVSAIGSTDAPEGYLLVKHDVTRPLFQSQKQLFLSAAPMITTSIVVAILISVWIYHRLLSPLERLSRVTRQVEQTGNYQADIDIRGHDEVSRLAQDISKLLKAIDDESRINKKQTAILLDQQKSMQRLANYDALTGLPNRLFFMDLLRIELARCERQGRDLAIMFIDVDGFKEVNDSLGHEAGDQLLVAVTQEISRCLRHGDVLARLGGDEFLIMMPELSDAQTASSVAARIVKGLQQPLNVNGWSVITGVSIGIARATDADFDINTFISNADIAMYASKEKGKGTFTEFHQGLLDESRRRLKLAGAINHALTHNEFSISYQPKVSHEGQVDGFEALIRWHNAEFGEVSPAEFIPIAEQGGKIRVITAWVLDRVCADMATLQRLGGPEVLVSVNISSHDLSDPEFLNLVQGHLRRYGVSIANIQLEITESSYLQNFVAANEFFFHIQQMGGSIALDDFGIGYSSLSYLTRINIDTLKIDQAFVSGYDKSSRDTVILKTILELAEKMGLSVCSEGIETDAQAGFVLSRGSHHLQGFLFARPVPINRLEQAVTDAQEQFERVFCAVDAEAEA